jgi:hypothetical protein
MGDTVIIRNPDEGYGTTEPGRAVNLRPATLTALGWDMDDYDGHDGTETIPVLRGNVAAHLVNLDGGGLSGINLGWRDQEASTDFLVGIVQAVEEAIEYGDTDDLHELADGAVPTYTVTVFAALVELGLGSEEPEIDGADSPIKMAQYVLYDYAYRLAALLIDAINEEAGE